MKVVFYLALVLCVSSAIAEDYKHSTCSDSDFLQGTWQDLVRMEPRIGQELVEIGKASGEYGPTVSVTNCRVSWPVDEKGDPLDGLRTAIIDKVWYSKDKTTGQSRLSHGGIKIVYHKKTETHCGQYCGQPYYRAVRAVRGIVLCRTPEVCKSLEIPFGRKD